MASIPRYEAWTDGSSTGRVGPGGWGVVVVGPNGEEERSGGAPITTNNRMEMMAALVVLRAAPEGSHVVIHSDASYLVNTMRQEWFLSWEENGWRNSRKKPVSNRDLWEKLIAAQTRHQVVEWVKVRGHVRLPKNESQANNARADRLAVAAKKRAQNRIGMLRRAEKKRELERS